MKMSISEYLKNINMSQAELSRILDISVQTVYGYYDGTAPVIRLDILDKLCKIFKCTPNDIIEGSTKYIVHDNDELPDDFITDIEVENNRDSFHIEASPKNNSNGLYADMYTEEEIDKLFESPTFSKRLGQYIEGIMNATNKKDGTE